MAAVMSDFHTESRFHGHAILAGPGPQISPTETSFRHKSRSKVHDKAPSPRATTETPPPSANARARNPRDSNEVVGRTPSAAEEIPSPPLSSSPKAESIPKQTFMSEQDQSPSPALRREPFEPPDIPPDVKSKAPLSTAPHVTIPRSVKSLDDVKRHKGTTIKVRDLAHIQSFADENYLAVREQSGRRRTAEESMLKYEISGMPITDVIEMVAGLLTKITTTNDHQHENLHRPTHVSENANLPGLSASVLAFHGKNVPSITILSYLSRIHKYCPTTYEVFLSLLVYFDRMTERVNVSPLEKLRKGSLDQDLASTDSDPEIPDQASYTYSASGSDLADSPPSAKSTNEGKDEIEATVESQPAHDPDAPLPFPLSHFFVVDSFNIHRLVIAGVTCASKFFSDVFYTNSRYAKVGGLPLPELNHLELQFLLLNDFRLSISVEELEAYGTMLVEFYAREVLTQREAGGESINADADADAGMVDVGSSSDGGGQEAKGEDAA